MFARRTPSPADMSIPAGTRVSTSDAPPTLFETTEARTLRRGEISVEAPIRALVAGRGGIVPADAIGVLHRPLLGIESGDEPAGHRFRHRGEDDAALRARLRRRLNRGKATTGALIGALNGIPGVREKDIRVAEDPIARPGLIEIDVALPPQQAGRGGARCVAARALALIEETRPAGVRVLARLAAPPQPGRRNAAAARRIPDEGPRRCRSSRANAVLPGRCQRRAGADDAGLSAAQQNALRVAGESEIRAFIEAAGLGEALVYNQLVSRLMAIPGILDVALEMSPAGEAGPKRKNILPAKPAARAAAGAISVRVGGVLVVLDVSLRITLEGRRARGAARMQRENARQKVEAELRAGVATLAPDDGSGSGTVTVAALRALLLTADEYTVDDLHYQASYEDAGLRVLQRDPSLPITGLERFWIGSVTLSNEAAA